MEEHKILSFGGSMRISNYVHQILENKGSIKLPQYNVILARNSAIMQIGARKRNYATTVRSPDTRLLNVANVLRTVMLSLIRLPLFTHLPHRLLTLQ